MSWTILKTVGNGLSMLLVAICSVIMFISIAEASVETQESTVSDGDECLKCHQKTWDLAMGKAYIHKPFLEKKCKYCHIQDSESVENSRGFMEDINVNWLDSRRVNTSRHWFKVPFSEINDFVELDYQVPGVGTVRDEIVIPPEDELKELVNDETPPEITNIKIKDLNRGLFLSATIAWTTDELSTSKIFYGLKKIDNETESVFDFTKDHRVQLVNLKYKKKYKFKIVSEDIYGNRAESKEFVFSTAKAKRKFSKHDQDEEEYPELQTKFKLYRLGDCCVFRIAANRPVIAAIGTPKKIEEKEEDLNAEGIMPENHNLTDALMANITVCEPCHGKYTKNKNHPINVPAKPGMRIPKDYFVLSNGNITCMTCHAAHSSDIEYRLARSSKKELCVGCHINKI